MPDLEIELAKVKAAVIHFFEKGVACQLGDQGSENRRHSALAPDWIEADVTVDPVDEQDNELGSQPQQRGQGQALPQFGPVKPHIGRSELAPAKDDQTEEQDAQKVSLQSRIDQ